MNKRKIRICGKIFLSTCLILSNFVYAAPITNRANPSPKQAVHQPAPTNNNKNPDVFSITSSQLGWSGPLSFGVSHDGLQGYSWNASYTQKLNDKSAFSGLIEYGRNMYRFGGTVGFGLLKQGLFKLSAERLSETLPFNFDSGSINQRVVQNAYGIRYQYNFKNNFWQDLGLGAYYAKAPNKSLDPVQFLFNGMNAINYRYIAGGTSKGLDISSEFKLSNYTKLTGHLYYDHLYYDTKYTASSPYDSQGIGGTLGINQLIGKYISVYAQAGKREIYDTYKVGISWLPPYLARNLGLEISVLGESIISHNQTPNSESISLHVAFNPGAIAAKKVSYKLPDLNTISDIGIWTSIPAVHMERVLAVSDQLTQILAPIITALSPDIGSVYGGTEVTITGKNLTGATAVTFDGMPAFSFVVISPSLITCIIPAHADGQVDVLVTTLAGTAKSSFVYAVPSTTAPIISSITPAALGSIDIDAVINGANFIKGAKVKFGSQNAVIKSIAATKIVVKVPQKNGAHSRVNVTVTNPNGEYARRPNGYTYKENNFINPVTPQNAVVMNPTYGPTSGGTTVVITGGAGYTAATTVTVDATTVVPTSFSATSLTFVTPGHGSGAVTVITNNPATPGLPLFTYHAANQNVISASAGSNGSISPTGDVLVQNAQNQTFTITPDAGYNVADVLVDGISVGAVTSYTFVKVLTNHTISATFAIHTHTITASAGPNGSISPAGAVAVNDGANQTFLITPFIGYHITDVVVDSVSQGAISSYTFNNVTAAHTISATFAIDTHTIAASAGANGSISPSGNITVNYGASQTFTITPDANYHVADVLVDGVSQGATTSYTFTNVTTNHTIAVGFAIDTYTITTTAGANGSISPSGAVSVNHGANQGFSIAPDVGYDIVDVLVDGGSVGAVTSYPFTNVTANHTISATFAIKTHTITATAGANGSISPSGAVSVNYGDDQSFTITPDANYHIADVLVDGVSQGAISPYTFTNVTTNHTIAVGFAIDTHTITASAGANGSISPSGAVSVNHGANQTFSMIPNAGYVVDDVLVDGVLQTPTPSSYTFTNVEANHTISVTFKTVPSLFITATAGANGSISPSGVIPVTPGSDESFDIAANTGYHITDVLVDGVSQGAISFYEFTNITSSHSISAIFAIDTYTITTTAGANGSISPSGAVSVNHGANQGFSIAPDVGYTIVDVLVDGGSQGAIASYTFNTVTANHTISATFAIKTHTITATAGANGSISPSGAVSVDYGDDSVPFIITADANYHIADVLVDGVSQGAISSYTFTNVTTNHTIAVGFAIDTHTITASAGANGSISPSGAVSVDHGASQGFSIAPDVGYTIVDVLVDGGSVGAVTSYTFTNVTANHTISATFAINTHTINASAGANGSISPSGAVTVNYGANQTFLITPQDEHYNIADVLVDGVSQGAISSYTFTNVTTCHCIAATFTHDTHTITSTVTGHGCHECIISPLGTVTIDHGASQTYNIVAGVGFHLTDVKIDGVSIGAVEQYTFTDITANHTINANFAISCVCTIAASAGSNGSISPSGAVRVERNTDQKFTITPSSGYQIVDVLVDGASVGAISSYTFTNVLMDHTITASFSQKFDKVKPAISFIPLNNVKYSQERQKRFQLISVTPRAGSVKGGAKVSIKFSKFNKPPTKITFGETPAKIIAATGDMVTVKVPKHKAGIVDITMSNPGESVTLPGVYTYKR